MRLNAPVQGLNGNSLRYMNSLVMHDALPAQHEPLFFHGGVPLALPAPTKRVRFLLSFKNGVVKIGTQCGVVRCLWNAFLQVLVCVDGCCCRDVEE